MDNRYYESGITGQILGQISTGMSVYDSNGDAVGHVDTVYFGSASTQLKDDKPPMQPDFHESGTEDTIYDAIVDTVNPTAELEEEIRQRLQYAGFVHVDSAAIHGADYFVTPDQIAYVEANQVHLHQTRADLISD